MSVQFILVAKDRKKRSEMTPAELKADDRAIRKGRTWNNQHPARIKNVVDHWNQATDEEKRRGMDWYADAHEMTKHIARDTGTPMHTMAGLMATYSPQTPWATNIMTAAKVARTRRARGGKGDGVMATQGQRDKAQRLLDGEHYDDVLKGRKVHAFAHLIEHGDNADESDPQVVIDRHALSVAAGARAPERAYEQSRLGTIGRYREISNVYHKAARKISKIEGHPVKAHQVQAATWLTRQRLNSAHDAALLKTATTSRSAKQAQRAIKEWNDYAEQYHPDVLGKEPGTGYAREQSDRPEDLQQLDDEANEGIDSSGLHRTAVWAPGAMQHLAYGETIAPDDIDTLQDEACPVCGEKELFQGGRCQVCNYFAPPKQFRDPDLTKARQMDLRKDVVDYQDPQQDDGTVDPSQIGMDGQPLDQQGQQPGGILRTDNTGDLEDDDQQGDPLGTQFDDPLSQPGRQVPDDTDTIDPDMLDEQGDPVEPQGVPDPSLQAFDGQNFQPGSNLAPGTPDDGTPDLVCPNCGYQVDASAPMTQDSQDKYAPAPDAGTQAGDVCSNCGQALLVSPLEMSQMQQQPVQAGQPVGV